MTIKFHMLAQCCDKGTPTSTGSYWTTLKIAYHMPHLIKATLQFEIDPSIGSTNN